MAEGNISEDPIEAIRRRNEERAARLREKLAAEGRDAFETTIDRAEELPAEDADEFNLGSFPPPPEPGEIPVGRTRRTPETTGPMPVTAPSAETPEIEIPPPPEEFEKPLPDLDLPVTEPTLEIEITPPALGPLEPPPFYAEEFGMETIPPPDIPEIPTAPVSAYKLADMVGGEEFEFPVPESWEGAPVPEPPPPTEEEPVPVSLGDLELPEIPRVTVPTSEEQEAPPEGVPVIELPEIPGISEEPALVIARAERVEAAIPPPPEPTEEEPLAIEPTVAEPVSRGAPVEEELVIKVSIEARGSKVRITRENIALDGTVELFKKIIERYEKR